MNAFLVRHPELVLGFMLETALPMAKWMLKQVQHDGLVLEAVE